MQYWRELSEVIDSEPANPRFHAMYGELAALGIEKGKSFAPDARMTSILEKAASAGNAQMRVESSGDRRPDRIVWPDRKWEWAALRFEDGDFNTPNYADLYARDKWFYQAIGASPAMFKRDTTAGSLYWLGVRDATGATLDGAKIYRLAVPSPCPASSSGPSPSTVTVKRVNPAGVSSKAGDEMAGLPGIAGKSLSPNATRARALSWLCECPPAAVKTGLMRIGPFGLSASTSSASSAATVIRPTISSASVCRAVFMIARARL